MSAELTIKEAVASARDWQNNSEMLIAAEIVTALIEGCELSTALLSVVEETPCRFSRTKECKGAISNMCDRCAALALAKSRQLQDTAGTESRTYKCFCGAQFIIRYPENCRWDEYEAQTLEDAGWVLKGREYRCPLHAENEP